MTIRRCAAEIAAGRRDLISSLVLLSLLIPASVATGESDGSTARTIRVRRVGTSTEEGRFRATVRAKRVTLSTGARSLGEALRQLEKSTGLQIVVAPSAKGALDREVHLLAWEGAPFTTAIELMLLVPGLEWGVRDGAVIVARQGEIDPRDDPDLDVRRYDVRPLLERSSKDALLTVLRSFVWPPEAMSSDVPRLELVDGQLGALQEERTHVVLEGVLNCMLNGGGNPLPWSKARRELEAALDRRVSVDFTRTHFIDVAELLADLLDQTVFANPGENKLNSVVTLRMKDAPIREVLRHFARELNCYVATKDFGVNILPEPCTDVRLHPVAGFERPSIAIDAAIKAVDDDSWSLVPRPLLWNDVLIVRQTEENLEKIEAALKALRDSRNEADGGR